MKFGDGGEYKGVFDISDAEGVNDSERLLVRLCRKSFLSLWSHANLHTDQDMRNGKGSAKEFADVLVVFGDDVVIFSDKHIRFQDDKDVAIAWPRWYARAIAESAKQLHGAMSWLRRFPTRIFLDSQCSRRLPVQLPPPERVRYHLVAVTRGSFDACARYYPGSLGTHQIRTDVEGKAHEKAPFTVGVLDRNKQFVHVFDEFSLEVVMDEMDTVTDFVRYLRARETFLSDKDMLVSAAGEEQLVAIYRTNGDENGHSFLPPFDNGQRPDFVMLDESHYPGLKKRPEYAEMRRANARSRLWDEMVERFIRLGDPAIVLPEFAQSNDETEQALRIMAAESRLRRRVLVESITGVLKAAAQSPGRRRARVFTTKQDPHLVYIFLVVPKRADEAYELYRRHRASLLHAYVRCAKLRFPEGTTFMGIGFDHPVKEYSGSSEDLIVYSCNDLTPEARAEAERFRTELGILADDTPLNWERATDFPQTRVVAGGRTNASVANANNKQKAKTKAKMAKASRKRNSRK